MTWSAMKSFLFQLDAEQAHHFGIKVLSSPLARPFLSFANESLAYQPRQAFGLQFRNPIGLAAGFDKNAEVIEALPAFGFGFVEVGTVTPRPQQGNPKPRLFRDVARDSLFNRMGFNNEGAERVASRLRQLRRDRLPKDFRIGLNIGKNKDTTADQAPVDYADAVKPFEGLIDYLVINVSSPNTPGLRELQNTHSLRAITESVQERIQAWSSVPPLLLKLAPEVQGEALREILSFGEEWKLSGWVLTNTLAGERKGQPGGWSGGCLKEVSRARLEEAKKITPLPIVSVGGILSSEECHRRLQMGAALTQIYSGWVYQGPNLPAKMLKFLRSVSY